MSRGLPLLPDELRLIGGSMHLFLTCCSSRWLRVFPQDDVRFCPVSICPMWSQVSEGLIS